MANLRHTLFDAGFSVIAATRADHWLRPVAQGKGVILTLHHVRPWNERAFAPNRFLEITPGFLEETIAAVLRAGFEFVPIDDVPERLCETRRRPPFAVLTFDDGYRDNLQYAWPILQRGKIPWTIYVVPEFLDGNGILWWIELERLVTESYEMEVSVGLDAFFFRTQTLDQKKTAFATIMRRLKYATKHELRAFATMAADGQRRDPGSTCRQLCLGWSEIAELGRDPLVTIGAHTSSHPILARLTSGEAEDELRESRDAIERRLSRPVRHLAYPHGDKSAAGLREYQLAQEAGYTTAVTTEPGHLRKGHTQNMHALPRVSVNGLHQTKAALRAIVSGVPFLAHKIALR